MIFRFPASQLFNFLTFFFYIFLTNKIIRETDVVVSAHHHIHHSCSLFSVLTCPVWAGSSRLLAASLLPSPSQLVSPPSRPLSRPRPCRPPPPPPRGPWRGRGRGRPGAAWTWVWYRAGEFSWYQECPSPLSLPPSLPLSSRQTNMRQQSSN